MSTTTAVAVSLEVDCGGLRCASLARPLLEQLSTGRYDVCSVLPLPTEIDEWEDAHPTASKRARRALKRGYYVTQVRREQHADAIHQVNISMPIRQKRPMASGYLTHQEYGPLPDYPCPRHAIRTWGVFAGDANLVGYLNMYRAGGLCLVSQILGHGDHLKREIMWLLFATAMSREIDAGRGFVIYNRWDSGTDGLRWWKEKCGFREMEVEWLP